MTADDYVDAVRSEAPRLHGSAATADWGAALGAAMRLHQRSVDEESVLPQLLGDLRDEVDASWPGLACRAARAVDTFMYSDRSPSTPVLLNPLRM